ncbi:MAG: hypothetical protein K1X66_01270 [Verrucomicrobiae bacterium]|nr:hypothetical protein [Verrucomicrobiae bacterium]
MKIGVNPILAWMAQVIGTFNDSAASKSWDSGWAVAEGANYATTAQALVKDIFDEADIKNQKIWPNLSPVSNYVPHNAILNVNKEFCSPGFTEMENP